MKITKVSILNLNSLKSTNNQPQVLDLKDPRISKTGIFAIIGDTGAGKSTILDAISLALYGRTGRGHQNEIMNRESGSCFAEVEFEVKGKSYRAKYARHRSRKKPDGALQTPKFEIASLPSNTLLTRSIKTAVHEKIEEITGLGYEQFRRSVILEQGEFARFLKSNEKDRGDLLERITGTAVYAQISKAAFAKEREENNKLANLKLHLDGIDILSPEIENELSQEIRNSKTRINQLKAHLSKLQEAVNWYAKMNQSKNALTETLQELEKIQHLVNRASKDFERLDKHEEVSKYKPLLEEIEYQTTQVLASDLEQKEIIQKLGETKVEQTEKVKFLENFSTELSKLEDAYPEQEKIWSEVEQIDITLHSIVEKLQLFESQAQSLLDEKSQSENQIRRQEEQIQLLKKEKKEIDIWIKEQQVYESLQKEISSIEVNFHTAANTSDDIKNLTTELINLEAQNKQKKQEALLQTEAYDRWDGSLKKLTNTFQTITKNQSHLSRTEMINDALQQWQNAQQEKSAIELFKAQWKKYKSDQQREVEIEKQLQTELDRKTFLDKRIPILREELQRINEVLLDKQKILDLEIRIGRYEDERKKLVPGEPCPVCLSTTHNVNYHAQVDHAKSERDRVAVDQRECESELYKTNNELEYVEAELQRLEKQKKIFKAEIQQFVSIQPSSNIPSLSFNKDLTLDKIETQEHILSQKIRLKKNVWHELTEVEKQIREAKLETESNKAKLALLKQEIAQFEATSEQLKVLIGQKKLDLATLQNLIIEKTKKYGIDWIDDELLSTLQIRLSAWQEKLERQTHVENKINIENNKFAHLLEKKRDLAKRLKTIMDSVHLEKTEQKEWSLKRMKLFGEFDVKQAKQKLQEKLSLYQKRHQSLKEEIAMLLSNIALLDSRLKSNQENIKAFRQRIQEKNRELLDLLETTDYQNVEELNRIILAEEDYERIQGYRTNLQTQYISKTALKDDLQNQIEKLQEVGPPSDDLETITEEINTTEEEIEKLQQDLGANNIRLKNNEDLKTKAGHQIKIIEQQRAHWLKWQALNELIGQSDGSKFKKFAQSITLNQLVHLANKYMRDLNPRYHIEKDRNKDLVLNIIDLYQANQKRSMNTLSGGESFLVSLALALGLSDLAGKNAQIQSLFIDEGFGTLDERTLDTAIQTLENLRNLGKTIGVISHVAALKERISSQVHVLRQGGGRSIIKLVG